MGAGVISGCGVGSGAFIGAGALFFLTFAFLLTDRLAFFFALFFVLRLAGK
jgi:hypothetical protein